MIIRISKNTNPKEVRKLLNKLHRFRKSKFKKLSDFYGKKKGIYANALRFQHQNKR